jgi:hypothetical protein
LLPFLVFRQSLVVPPARLADLCEKDKPGGKRQADNASYDVAHYRTVYCTHEGDPDNVAIMNKRFLPMTSAISIKRLILSFFSDRVYPQYRMCNRIFNGSIYLACLPLLDSMSDYTGMRSGAGSAVRNLPQKSRLTAITMFTGPRAPEALTILDEYLHIKKS